MVLLVSLTLHKCSRRSKFLSPCKTHRHEDPGSSLDVVWEPLGYVLLVISAVISRHVNTFLPWSSQAFVVNLAVQHPRLNRLLVGSCKET